MKIEELAAIIKYAETDPKQRVMIKVHLQDGHIANADIKSFGTYDDGLLLNVEI